MVTKINGYLITRSIGHKYLVKVRPFRAAKVECLEDHEKPTMRDFNPRWMILNVGTNDLSLPKTASQIAKSIIDLATSINNTKTSIVVSLLVPRGDNLNNKANEVNYRLRLMCRERDYPFIDHSDYIKPEIHLDENKLHFNKYGITLFAKKLSSFISDLY